MFSLRSTTSAKATKLSSLLTRSSAPIRTTSSNRTFTTLIPLRPTLTPTFRASQIQTRAFPSPETSSAAAAAGGGATATGIIDLLPKISSHPALGATQVRCGPRDTYSPSHFVRKRRHGFLSRIRTRKGRATLQRRKKKGRQLLSH